MKYNSQNQRSLHTARKLADGEPQRWKNKMKRWPFTIWAACALTLVGLMSGVRLEYDQNVFMAFVTFSQAVWAFMFWVPDELLFSLNHGQAVQFQNVMVCLMGFTLCLALDLTLKWINKLRNQKTNRTSNEASQGMPRKLGNPEG